MHSSLNIKSFIIASAFIATIVQSSPGIPNKIDITVPCINATSYCGFNGVCKKNGPVHICKCESGYSTLDIKFPCAAKGQSQAKLSVLTYFFGWSGATCFMLGWTAWGIVTLVLCLNGVCCTSYGKEKENSLTLCWGIMCTIAYIVIWIYIAITISVNHCVDDKGVACKGW